MHAFTSAFKGYKHPNFVAYFAFLSIMKQGVLAT